MASNVCLYTLLIATMGLNLIINSKNAQLQQRLDCILDHKSVPVTILKFRN